ncbi:MAG: CDP-diacylglycerol--glycerol-3-phosphate 3-phosphatidyltransferase [Candidatus Edwardsbacteria bacterium]
MNLPNKLTLSRIILSLVFMVFILINHLYSHYLALFIFIVAALTDVGDGYLARRNGEVTSFGRFMDPMADKLLVSMAFISFVALKLVEVWMVLVIVGREFLIMGLRTLVAYRGSAMSSSLLAKYKTATQMSAAIIILLYFNLKTTLITQGIAFPWSERTGTLFLNGLVFLAMALTVISAIDYLLKNVSLWRGILK